jgi:hypothetical protein
MLKSWASHLTGPPVNPWMLRTAGEVADGVHVHPLGEPGYLKENSGDAMAASRVGVGLCPLSHKKVLPRSLSRSARWTEDNLPELLRCFGKTLRRDLKAVRARP